MRTHHPSTLAEQHTYARTHAHSLHLVLPYVIPLYREHCRMGEGSVCMSQVSRMIGMRKAACGICRLGFSTVRLNPGMQLYLRYLTMISGRQELGLRKRAVSADTYTRRVGRVRKERGKTTGANDGGPFSRSFFFATTPCKVFVTSINLHLHVQRNLV